MTYYAIPYTDIHGLHTTHKWATDDKEARDMVKKARPTADVGKPIQVEPQPFDDEARRQHSARLAN